MRLLHVVRTLNPATGGPSESVRMFVLAHQRAGNEVEVATLDAPGEFGSAINCDVHACGPGLGIYGFSRRLPQWLRENSSRFDGVIVNAVWQFHGVAVRTAFARRRPYAVFAHGMLDPYFMRRYPLKHLKKLAYWTLEESRNLHAASAVCFTSEEEQKNAARGFPFGGFNRVVIPYGTTGPSGDPTELRQAFFSTCPHLANRRFLLFLGRIHPKKGCDILLDAFAHTAPPDLELVIAGPDQVGLVPALQEQARRLEIDSRVHWTGMLSGPAKWGAFLTAEAFILPSHQENFGIAVADALACGLVPLVSDKVNIAAQIVADGAGLVEPDTLEGTERLIQRFLLLSSEQLAQTRLRAYECYRQRYALKNSAAVLYEAMGLIRNGA